MSSTININGKTYTGKNIQIDGKGNVIIDGKNVESNDKVINIEITGDIQSLDVASCQSINVSGMVNTLNTVSGDVTCGDVNLSVKTTSGDVKAKNIGGSVTTISGDVEADKINGSVNTVSGDIN